MKFCTVCGKQVADNAETCPDCGYVFPKSAQASPAVNDESSFGYAVLGFFIPLVGLILYLMWKSTTPLRAKSAGKGALIGFIISTIFSIIYGVALASYLAPYMN